jgi:hypothetical protein
MGNLCIRGKHSGGAGKTEHARAEDRRPSHQWPLSDAEASFPPRVLGRPEKEPTKAFREKRDEDLCGGPPLCRQNNELG